MLLAGAALAPWFWGSAMRFRLNATRWRGVRLQFTRSWGEVYRASWPLFVIAHGLDRGLLGATGAVAGTRRPGAAGGVRLSTLFAAVLAACSSRSHA
jgi:uncharacterized membrane protein YjgN (DUF898 family)